MKSKTTFVCLGCQQQFPRWSGRRPKQTAADLDALEKSILHQAFAGKL